jgi:hypothetical protein
MSSKLFYFKLIQILALSHKFILDIVMLISKYGMNNIFIWLKKHNIIVDNITSSIKGYNWHLAT